MSAAVPQAAPTGAAARPPAGGASSRGEDVAQRQESGHASAAARPALELVDVHKSFGRTQIIRGLNLTVRRGERHAVIGPNGAGKSTMFHLVSGRIPVSSGSIRLDGREITGMPPYRINRLGLSRSFQITNIFHNLTVFENLRCSVLWSQGHGYAFWKRLNRLRDVTERADEVLRRLGLQARRNTLAGLLTYAEQRALEIGITIAGGARTILLDEPTAGMSRHETERVVQLIQSISEGRTLVMVEHDMSVVFGLADRISVVVYGQVIATDTPQNIRENVKVQQAYLGTAMEAHA